MPLVKSSKSAKRNVPKRKITRQQIKPKKKVRVDLNDDDEVIDDIPPLNNPIDDDEVIDDIPPIDDNDELSKLLKQQEEIQKRIDLIASKRPILQIERDLLKLSPKSQKPVIKYPRIIADKNNPKLSEIYYQDPGVHYENAWELPPTDIRYRPESTPNIKCQNRKGKKCIQFRGKNIYYTNIRDLSQKLKIPVKQATKLEKDNGRRIIIGPGNNTLRINIKHQNFSSLLKTEFGINRINNKSLIDDAYIKVKDVEITNKLGPNAEIKVMLKIAMYINFPSEVVTRHNIITNGKVDLKSIQELLNTGQLQRRDINTVFNGHVDGIQAYAASKVSQYMANLFPFHATLIHSILRIGSSYRQLHLNLVNGYVRDFNNVFELTEWTNIEYNTNYTGKDTCAVRIIGKRFPDLYWKIKYKETEHGITLIDFINFCIEYSIAYNIYNEHGRLLYQNTGKLGILSCIVYNNHMYPIIGGKPKRYSTKEYKITHINDSFEELKKYLDDAKKLPSQIKIDSLRRKDGLDIIKDINITSYTIKDNRFICNDEYKECLEILEKMNYSKYIYDDIRITDIPRLLEKILKVDDVSSFIPEKQLFKTSPLLWKTPNKIDEDPVTIDKNTCYSYALYSLPYLIKFDYRKHGIGNSDTILHEIIHDTSLYIARPKYWTILMPVTQIYPGYFLSECREIGIDFDLLEQFETDMIPNYFRKIIMLMHKNMSRKSFKTAMNIFIGSFERNENTSYIYDYVGIYSDEASNTQEGFCCKVGNYNLMFKETKQYLNVRDRLPIAIQVKAQSRMMLYKKMKELHINSDNVVQINTDSISYYGELPKGLNPLKFDGWKSSEFKELGDLNNFVDQDLSALKIINTNDKSRILHMKYAGAGKTTYIINKLVPKLIKDNISFIVITPTHPTLDEYRQNNINCEIMQKFAFANTIPKEDHIIIDEIGFIDRSCHDLLYKINKANKSFECFGDFNQLQPVGELLPLNREHYLKYMFNVIDTEFINYRNNFTKEYYDELINEKCDLIDEVKKWSCKEIHEAQYILCYRHKTKKKYNKYMLKYLGFNDWIEIGVKIVCTSNKLLSQNIFNHKQFTITYIDDDNICTLSDNNNKDYFVTKKKLSSNFEPAYTINAHQAQGGTLDSYFWAEEDDIFINGHVAYTIISRLRQKKEYPKKISITNTPVILSFD